MKPRTIYDDSPAHHCSVLSQTAHYFSGIMGGLTGLVGGLSLTQLEVPKYRKRSRRNSTTHSGRTQRRSSNTQQANTDNDACPSYVQVCCENGSPPVEKPPEYWVWMKEQKTKDTNVFISETPPPLYEDVVHQSSCVAGTTETSSVSETDVTRI